MLVCRYTSDQLHRGKNTLINQNPIIVPRKIAQSRCFITHSSLQTSDFTLPMRPFAPFSFPVQQPKCKHHKINTWWCKDAKCIRLLQYFLSTCPSQNNFGIIHLSLKSFREYLTLFWTKLIKGKCLCASFGRPEILMNDDKGKQTCSKISTRTLYNKARF